ncbi:MAG: adenylate/guanylate cyclase domain-containing protein [Proteobacteria bacterium]|nr:adenylate/guanylate cyclase domain-containing protein [Pseudomonadota bacterium]
MTDSSFDPDATARLDARLGAAFQDQERQGLKLAAHLRGIASLAISIWLIILLGKAGWFYIPIIALFVASGYGHYLLSRRGFRSDAHAFGFFLFDVVIITFALLTPNPLLPPSELWPPQARFRFGGFNYYYLLISLFLLGSYSARAMLFAGVACVIAWGGGILWIAGFPDTLLAIPTFETPAARLERFLDPHFVSLDVRTTEILVMLLSTTVLAIAVLRSRRLIRQQMMAARERSNLARYFPPNIVDELAGYDGALETVQSQEVGVLFADLVGFSRFAEMVTPEELIEMLRAFHHRMERTVFEHGGTLDKFLGDGVMATFGTPRTGPQDAANTLRCARAMLSVVDEWNTRRAAAGFPVVQLSAGAHFGPIVMGDVGSERRLEFAVVGDTVNVASRLEESTRAVGSRLIVSDVLMRAVQDGKPDDLAALRAGIVPHDGLSLRGREGTVDVWMLGEGDESDE